MRHDPASSALVIMLRSLKMHGMAQAVDELAQQGAPAFETAIPVLSQLLKAETAEREVRSMAYQLKVARFPVYRDLAGFDFSSSEVNEALVRQLHRCDFIEPVDNVVLVGGPGTGKTHIATALGVQAIEHHKKRARFFSTVELVTMLSNRKRLRERLVRSQAASSTSISLFSTNSATCPSVPQAELCCSISSANSTSAPASSSLPISASANQDDDSSSRPPHPSLPHLGNRQ